MPYLLGTLLEVGEALILPAILFGCIGAAWLWSKWVARQPVEVARRVRPEREPEIDLAAERYAFIARRDSYEEQRELRRVAS